MNAFVGRRQTWLVLGLLGLLCLLAWTSVAGKSPTYDEPSHVAVGYAAWVDGVQKWDFINPALSRRWLALPLLLYRLDLPAGVTSFPELARRFLFENRLSPEAILGWSRAMTLLAAIWLGLGVYFWSRGLFGPVAGLLSLMCIILDPNVLAHAALATTDVLATATFLWSVYLFWRLSRQKSVWAAVWAGSVLGLALQVKYSSLVLVPVLWLLLALTGARDGRRQLFWLALLALGLAVTVVFVGQGMELISPVEFANEQRALHGEQPLGEQPGWATVRIPFVRYLYGMLKTLRDFSDGRTAFLMGRLLSSGTPLYFPVVFTFKTPLSILILLAWSTATVIGRMFQVPARDQIRAVPGPAGPSQAGWGLPDVVRAWADQAGYRWRDVLFLAVPPLVYVAFAVAGRLNLGYRHLLPIVPFLYVGIGSLAGHARRRRARLALGALILWLAAESLLVYPHYLAYFNLAVGGPAAGHRYLVDSNLDWGQELVALANYQETRQTGPVYLGYFGTADPDAYGIKYRCLPSWRRLDCTEEVLPAEGWIAVSATCLQGMYVDDPGFYAPLRDREPAAVLGHSMFLYRLP